MFHPKVSPASSSKAKAPRFKGPKTSPSKNPTASNTVQRQSSNQTIDRQTNAANQKSCCNCSIFGQILLGSLIVLLLAASVVIPILFTQTFSPGSQEGPVSTTPTTTVTTETSTTSVTETTTTTSSTTTTTTTSTTSTSTTSTSTTTSTTTATTTTTTSALLPAQCSSYVLNTDATRNVAYTATISCDSTIFGSGQWVRFSGAAGTQIATTVVPSYSCGTHATGYYTGVMPAAGATATGTVCYNWSGNSCNWSNSISVTNCNGFYLYYLINTFSCSLRYCTI